jgi:NDP-sugar pyrophosphorylase family protein
MRAIILAGGKGRRLRPYTTIFPKPLMPIGDIPILAVVLHQLRHYGFSRVTIAVGHLAELLMAYLNNGRQFGLAIDFSHESKPLGTAGPLRLIPDLTETFLVMNGDLLTTLDYTDLVRFHHSRKAAATIAIFPRPVYIDLGIVHMDEDNRLVGYVEKPTLYYQVSMGVYVFEPKVLDYIPYNAYMDFPDLVKTLLNAGELVVGFPHDGYWLDLGRHEDYEQALTDFEQMRSLFLPGENGTNP